MAFKTRNQALKQQLRIARGELFGVLQLVAGGRGVPFGFEANVTQMLHLLGWTSRSESERSRAYALRIQETLGQPWLPKDIDQIIGVYDGALSELR